MTQNVPTKSLIDAFPDWFTGDGIFSEMTGVPWEDEISADLLDMDYFGNHSGWKKCSPLVYKLFDDEYKLSDTDREKLASLVLAKFLPNWTALWNTYHLEYNPITDYDVVEEGEREGSFQKSRSFEHEGTRDDTTAVTTTHGHTVTEVGSQGIDETSELTHGESISESVDASSEESGSLVHGEEITVADTKTTAEDITLTHGEVIEKEGESESTDVVSKWGFNSTTDPVPADKRENSSSNSSTETHSGDDVTDRDMTVTEAGTTTHSGTDTTGREVTYDESKLTSHTGKDTTTLERDTDESRTTTHGGADTSRTVLDGADTASDTTEDTGSDTDEYTKHFSGLKGYTSRQELIERERALWRDSFFDKVYSDVDSVLASLIYKREHRVSPYALFPFGYYSI